MMPSKAATSLQRVRVRVRVMRASSSSPVRLLPFHGVGKLYLPSIFYVQEFYFYFYKTLRAGVHYGPGSRSRAF
jgi:hypothetical protein